MSFERDLIYDIGVFNGDDSAYYLHKGYRVVGVEANPLLLPHLRERFDAEIHDGRYTLLDVAISDFDGEAQFWICDDVPPWSSIDLAAASHGGARHHSVSVRACRFGSLLSKFGSPFYCKIDIEGCEHLCLDDMTGTTRPPFISLELGAEMIGPASGGGVILRLRELGYRRFKIVSQLSFRQPSRALAFMKASLHPSLSSRIGAAAVRLTSDRTDGDWRFPPEASGPFGADTRGKWLTAVDATNLVGLLQQNAADSDWYDIHAAVDDADGSWE
jgi:FkbM family methyltransferase